MAAATPSISWILQFFSANKHIVRLSSFAYNHELSKVEVAYLMVPQASLEQLKAAHVMLKCIMNSLADNDVCEITKLRAEGWAH